MIKGVHFPCLLLLIAAAKISFVDTKLLAKPTDKPDIPFIVVDDMKDWISLLDPKPPSKRRILKIDLPLIKKNDWNDLLKGAENLMHSKKWFCLGMMQVESKASESYKAFIRPYAACASFADAQIGRVLDALDQCPHGKGTIVVLWFDYDFHIGEKNHIVKFAL
jgi:hypothetical protein